MSENEKNVATTEEKFEIGVDETEKFRGVAEQNIITSTNLCHMLSKFFEVYDDFMGLRLEVAPNGTLSLTSFFKHLDYGKDAITAFSKDANVVDTANEGLNRIRRQARIREEGIKFYPTKEGKEGIEDYILIKNNKGKVNWNNVTADVTNPTTFGQTEVVSMINYIDPVKLLRTVYGTTDEEGNEYDYMVNVISSKPVAYGTSKEYILSVIRFNKKELDRAARDTGIVVGNYLGIVR